MLLQPRVHNNLLWTLATTDTIFGRPLVKTYRGLLHNILLVTEATYSFYVDKRYVD